MRRQHRVDRAPGKLAVADLAALGAAEASGLTDRVGREVVVQQERLFVRSRQRVDVLLVLAGAERGDDQALRLAAGEQRRAVGARQHADFGDDVAHGLAVATVDALAGVEDVPANDLRLELLEHGADAQLVVFRLLPFGEVVGDHLFLDLADRGVAILLDRNGVGGTQLLLDDAEHLLLERGIVDDGDFARLFRGLLGQLDDGVDHRLEVAVTEHHGAEHDLLVQLLGFRFHHQHGVGGAGDDQVELGIDHLVERRVEDELVIGEADAGRADRALERSAGQGQRSGRSHQRDDIGIVLHVVRQHGDDHLGLVAPAVDEQRTDRTVDQAGDQRLLLGRTTFALEIAAGNAARSVGLFLVVDGQRQEVDALARRLRRDDGGENHGLAIGGDDGAVGLTGDLAGFQLESASTPVDLDRMLIEHRCLLSWVLERRDGSRKTKTMRKIAGC